MRAKQIIEQEHRSLAAVLHGLLFVVREIRFGAKPDFTLLRAMLEYIDTFSERFHHPKEDAHLFPRLRLRHAGAAALIERLEDEHAIGGDKLRALRRSLARYEESGEPAFGNFAAQATTFAAFHWQHMRAEEDEVLPLAQAYLTPDDWAAIDAAFVGNTDPLLGLERGEEFQELFRRIVELAPAPVGRGHAQVK